MRWFVAILFVGLLAACNNTKTPEFRGTDITGVDFGKRLELIDHHGRPRQLTDFKGKLVVLFFGYTHCPDVCPTTLSDTASALRQLTPDEAARVQVLFVSVDPERDSLELLQQYVPYFNPTFLGLWGTPAQVAAAAKEFRVFYRKHQEPGVNGYTVDHTAGSYVLDATGRLRLLFPFALPAEDMAHDLRLLLHAG